MASTQKPFSVHFVCRGNVFRSRLAAAYFDTLVDERFTVTSSGINAAHNDIPTISPQASVTAKAHHLNHGLSKRKVQTTDKLLADADVIVFMNKDVYDDALRHYRFDVRKCQVWDVHDVTQAHVDRVLAAHEENALLDAVAARFRRIQILSNDLHTYLTHTAWVDVVDTHNKPTGLRLPMAWVTDRGLWHRGVHIVAQTVDGKFIVEKRASNIVFSPGMLDISLGGGVDSGEHPLQAAARETHEELGIHTPEKHFRPLFMYKKVGYHPHYNKQTKGHIYVYSVKLPVHSSQLHPQLSEVAEIRALSLSQVKQLLRSHRLRNFGRLSWSYKLYNKALAYSSLPD